MRTIQRDIAGVFIVSGDNKVLLGKTRGGGVYSDRWVPPGGGIDIGETALEAAIREAKEEVGIDISQFHITQDQHIIRGASEKTLRDTGETVIVNMNFYNFIAKTDSPADTIAISCDDDIVHAQWHPLKTLHTLPISKPMSEFLQTTTLLQ